MSRMKLEARLIGGASGTKSETLSRHGHFLATVANHWLQMLRRRNAHRQQGLEVYVESQRGLLLLQELPQGSNRVLEVIWQRWKTRP